MYTARFSEENRKDIESIRNLLIKAPDGYNIPLDDLAHIKTVTGLRQISREDTQRYISIQCNVRGRDTGSFVQEAQKTIDSEVDIPPGYYVTFGGQFESQQRALRHLGLLMLVVMLIIFIVLFSSLGSLWQAFLIILNIPTTLIGGIIGLIVAGQTINVSSMIGLIALFGICVQNDVILVAKINDFRRRGRSLRDAVLEGALTKFRPILMTDMVMIVSVLPLALTVSTGAELHRPLAVVYIGGFFFAILLRLIIVPLLYETMGKLAEKKG